MGNVPVSGPGSLSCLPGPGSDLQRQHDQGDADHDDDEELGRPDLWCHVSVAHRGKGDDAEVEGLEEGELLTCSFQMLDAAGAAGGKHRALEHKSEKIAFTDRDSRAPKLHFLSSQQLNWHYMLQIQTKGMGGKPQKPDLELSTHPEQGSFRKPAPAVGQAQGKGPVN